MPRRHSSIAVLTLALLTGLPTARGRLARAEPGDAIVTCHVDKQSPELKVDCSDGKSWTVKSIGLILPPVLRCSTQHPECCQVGFRKLRDVQREDLIRAGEGQAPVCHMLVKDFLHNQAPPVAQADDDEIPPGLRGHPGCPKGQYPAGGKCHDPEKLVRALSPLPLRDKNRPLVPEAAEVVSQMRRDFDRTGKCPYSALDIEVLQRIYAAAQLRSELIQDSPLDVEPLLGRAQAPQSVQPEPGLGVACGHNATFKTWYQTSFHCLDQNVCYAQSHKSLMHACVRFERATTAAGTSPYFWPMANCQNIPSCRDNQFYGQPVQQCTGAARLTALGQGIYLMIQQDPTGAAYYYGVLFSRRPAPTSEQVDRAMDARNLLKDMERSLKNPSDRARLRKILDNPL